MGAVHEAMISIRHAASMMGYHYGPGRQLTRDDTRLSKAGIFHVRDEQFISY